MDRRIVAIVPNPDETMIVQLTSEATPHVAVIRDFLGKWMTDGTVPDDEYRAYLASVDSFKAIRDRMPVCDARDAWDRILGEAEGVIHIPSCPNE